MSAKSYAGIPGANERIRVGVMGVNNRGKALADNFARQDNCEVICISDVDTRAAEKCIAGVEKIQNTRPEAVPDFRKALENKQLDALVIATPDHWHAHATIFACQAGKHVYVEKPCSYAPREGELLVEAEKKYKTVIQMGNQRRSWPNVMQAIEEVQQGTIGRPYFGKAWYGNNRPAIGKGKEAPVPSWLNYDLWQGPVPRRPYRDNLIHYNWHWFWHWGTGELMGNGVHALDLLRWGMQVDYPVRVTSAGGRYRYDDDWETPDTQVATLEFSDNISMAWEGRSCNGHKVEGESVGVMFYGEKGSLMIGAGNTYKIYDPDNKLVKEAKADAGVDALNRTNPSQALDALHLQNFLDGIRKGTPQRADITGGHQSTLLCQLGNIAQRSGKTLEVDPDNGHIKDEAIAREYWQRTYEPGWELVP